MDEKNIPVLHCPTCYATSFQISKPRPEDRLQRLLFRTPVRCKNCRARVYAGPSYIRWLRKEQNNRGAAKGETPAE